jgi:hypothetical protein
MVEQGKIREFRDGLERLFRVDEVEAVAPQTSSTAPEETPPVPTAESIPPETEVAFEEEAPVEVGGPEPEGAVTDMPSFDIRVELGMLDTEESARPEPVDTSEPATAAVSAEDLIDEERLDVQPPAPSRPSPPAPMAYARLSAPKESVWQWFVSGLRQDRPAAVIVLFVVLGIILSGCAAVAYLLHKLL